MKTTLRQTLVGKSALAVTAMVGAASAKAEDFQYEVGGDYVAQSFKQSGTALSPEFQLDANIFALQGTWSFDPVSTEKGPLSQAAFLDRASSLRLGVARIDPEFSSEGDALSVFSRYVFDDSDWFLEGGYTYSSSEGTNTKFVDRTYDLSVGRYFGARTAASFGIGRTEFEASFDGFFDSKVDATLFSLALSHIGDLGDNWQFGINTTLTMPEDDLDDGLLEARFSLFPTRELAFGFDFSAAIKDTGDRPRRYGVFGSWFVTESLELSANYGWVESGSSGFSDNEEKSWGIGARYRF